MIQLIQVPALLIAGRDRIDLFVSVIKGGREAAEQLCHGQIGLKMPDIDSRIDQDRLSHPAAQGVAGPQISMQHGRKGGLFDPPVQMVQHGSGLPQGMGIKIMLRQLDLEFQPAFSVKILLLQHPNGKWVKGYDVSFPSYGTSSLPSVFDDQYDTRMEALKAEMDSLIEYIGHHQDDKNSRDAITRLKKERMNLSQLSLFV